MPEKRRDDTFAQTLQAAASTAELLASVGLEDEPEEDDLIKARSILREAAHNPHAASIGRLTKQTPVTVLMVRELLKEYGQRAVEEAEEVRHLVLNKLMLETENPDPRVRLRALELIGKVTDVGMFTERKEVTVTHQSSDDVRERLRAKLARLLPQAPETLPEAEVIPAPEATPVDLAEELEDDPEDQDDPDLVYELSLEPRRAQSSLFGDVDD